MTKIYCYCLFDRAGSYQGVYSSLKAVHRDALKMANKGNSDVVLLTDHGAMKASLVNLRNVFKGKIDVQVLYRCGEHQARIIKTDFKE